MERIKLLLVDDEEDFRTTLANRLKKRGFEVTAVGSGKGAVEAIAMQTVDVAVVDVKMPGMDGLQTLRALKGCDAMIEVIMLTGHASVESGVEGMRGGAFDYVVKPCDISDLVMKIEDAYQRKLAQTATFGDEKEP
jgi:DNA-binding NtrC family response regulator